MAAVGSKGSVSSTSIDNETNGGIDRSRIMISISPSGSTIATAAPSVTTSTTGNGNTNTTETSNNGISNATLNETNQLSRVCSQGEEKSRKLCHFTATEEISDELYLHVFCGKTAAILPHVNRPDLEILTKAGIKNKHGTGVSVTLALQRCRSAKVDDASGREQEYFLSKEFERIYLAITKEPTVVTPDDLMVTAPHDQISFEDLDVHHEDALQHHQHDDILPNSIYATQNHAQLQDQPSSVTPDQHQASIDHHTEYFHLQGPTPSHYATDLNLNPSHPYYDSNPEPPNKKQRQDTTEAAIETQNTPPTLNQTQTEAGTTFGTTTTTTTSPYDIEMERLQAVCDRCDGVGYSLVRGVARSNDTADDANFDPTNCSQEQVDHVRVIVITKDRQERMEQMGRLVLGKQYGKEFLHFNTSFSYDVLKAWNEFTVRFHAANTNKQKFDLLLGFTHTIKEHDVWMHDHEPGWGGDDMVRQLGQSWSFVLPQPDADLGVDSEFTRPGIIALLEQFKEAVESAQTQTPMQFNFAVSS